MYKLWSPTAVVRRDEAAPTDTGSGGPSITAQ